MKQQSTWCSTEIGQFTPEHWLSKTTSPDEGHFPLFSPLATSLATFKRPEGDLEGCFWSFWPMAKKFHGPTMTGLDGGQDRVRVGGLCLLSSFICVIVFLIDYTPIVSFIFLSNHQLLFKGGAVVDHPPPPFPSSTSPLHSLQMASAAHTSALCANHAHRLQILCLSRHAHTQAHSDTLKLVL